MKLTIILFFALISSAAFADTAQAPSIPDEMIAQCYGEIAQHMGVAAGAMQKLSVALQEKVSLRSQIEALKKENEALKATTPKSK